MKKLLKKRYLIPLIAAVVLAVGGTIAYAAWQTSASTANTVTTGSTQLTLGSGAVIPGSFVFYPAFGPSSQYAWTNNRTGYVHPITVQNTGNAATPITFSAGVTPSTATLLTSGVDLSKFHVQYAVTGGANAVTGTQTTTLAALIAGGVQIDSSLAVNGTDSVSVTVWLDTAAGIQYEGLTGTVLFTFSTASFGD
jgi:hypothetical protein